MKIGTKLRMPRDCDIFNLGFFPAGTTGTVVSHEDEYEAVKLDQHFEELDEWDNEVHIYADSEISYEDFEVID